MAVERTVVQAMVQLMATRVQPATVEGCRTDKWHQWLARPVREELSTPGIQLRVLRQIQTTALVSVRHVAQVRWQAAQQLALVVGQFQDPAVLHAVQKVPPATVIQQAVLLV